jgi:hypothetical protein
MDEKASMMAHSDVFVTVYSTMVVETAVHDTPIIAAVIDTPGGWNKFRTSSRSRSKKSATGPPTNASARPKPGASRKTKPNCAQR